MLSTTSLEFFFLVSGFLRSHDVEDIHNWGNRASTQVLIALAVRELATGVQDAGLRGQIRAAADEVIVKSSRNMAEPSDLETMTA